jgi:plastocyanin
MRNQTIPPIRARLDVRGFAAARLTARLWAAFLAALLSTLPWGLPWAAAVAPESSAQPSNTIRIDVENFMFAPASMTVKAGATVTWTNMDQEPHTVMSPEGLFRSGALDTGDSFSFKFDKPGTYRYVCTIHPRMVGTVVVE